MVGLDRPGPAGKGVRGEHGGLSSHGSHMGQPGEGSMNHFAIGPASFAWPWKQRARREWSRWWHRPFDRQPQSARQQFNATLFSCVPLCWAGPAAALPEPA